MTAFRRAATALDGPAARVARLLRRHWLFALLLGAGLALRVLVLVAYTPALFSPDSNAYLDESEDLHPTPLWPLGYPALLRALPLSWGMDVVPILQHSLGLAAAGVLYAVLLRVGVPNWLAALAAAPVLLDAYQLILEEYVLSETLFEAFIVAGAAVLLWRSQLEVPAAALSGLLLSGAALTRAVGVLALVPALVAAILLAGRPWPRRLMPAAALAAVCVAVLGGYAAWYHSWYGSYALAGDAGRRLYGRVAPWVECEGLSVPDYEQVLCPQAPPGERKRIYDLVWTKSSPINRVQVPAGTTRVAAASDFSRRVIRQQPFGYLRSVGGDVLASFGPAREQRPGGHRVEQWRFQKSFPIAGFPPSWSTATPGTEDNGDVRAGPAGFLRSYQAAGYLPGPLLALGLLVAVVSLFPVGSAARAGLRTATFLFIGLYVALCVVPLLAAPFSWRYQLPQLLLIPPAAALGITALFGWRSSDRHAS
jgi:hypothetical protein